jgi:ferredoxin-NADP reductase
MLLGVITEELLRDTIPDWQERLFYVSGPQVMVSATRRALLHLGVSHRRIKTDFFPGLA